ncbi:unnamed protein product [Ectocarpus sp. 8 AP-2014]
MATASSYQIPDEVETIDWSSAAEQCGGDESFLKEMLVMMHEEIKSHMVNLRNAVAANEMEPTRHIAHTIKGVATKLNVSPAAIDCTSRRDHGKLGNMVRQRLGGS